MSSSAVSITLQKKKKLNQADNCRAIGPSSSYAPAQTRSGDCEVAPFFRIPPFPGSRIDRFAQKQSSAASASCTVEEVRQLKVGGTFWGAQPKLPSDFVLVRSARSLMSAEQVSGGRKIVFWDQQGEGAEIAPGADSMESGDCDPWHMLSSATALVTEPEDELRLVAALLEVPCHIRDPGTGELELDRLDAAGWLTKELSGKTFENPFTGQSMTGTDLVRLCGFWRQLIDSNREVGAGLGFAFWKQDHVAPLLWGGSGPVRFLRNAAGVEPGTLVAVWRAKAAPDAIEELERNGNKLIEVEDGFLRSRGLGADCIPPLSITVDRLGAYFDPAQSSELEDLLQTGVFEPQLLARARELRNRIVAAGLGKYEQGKVSVARPAGDRRHVLVPGQVEDDRAVQTGGCGLASNLELLKRARAHAPDAYILYKPHPDVVAGHRRGAVPDRDCLQYADEIVGELSIGSLIDMVDEVHVNTSLAGFEALLRGKRVTTFGVPFYAGWGLTRDVGPVPSRRSATRTIDELVAVALLLYPRYLDPVTGLPCPAEVVVARLCEDEERDPGMLVGMRRLQGKLMRRLRSLVQ